MYDWDSKKSDANQLRWPYLRFLFEHPNIEVNMRQIMIAMLSGVVGAVVASTFITPSMARNEAERVEAAMSSGACHVKLKNNYVAYHWCNDGDVQTGTYNDTIYCSTIEVTCP
jgi:hypothetical protein